MRSRTPLQFIIIIIIKSPRASRRIRPFILWFLTIDCNKWKRSFPKRSLKRRILRSFSLFVFMWTENMSENDACPKRSPNQRNLRNFSLFVLVRTENMLTTGLFENDGAVVRLKHISKITSDCFIFKFLQRSVNGKYLIRVKPPFSKSTSAVRTRSEYIVGLERSRLTPATEHKHQMNSVWNSSAAKTEVTILRLLQFHGNLPRAAA